MALDYKELQLAREVERLNQEYKILSDSMKSIIENSGQSYYIAEFKDIDETFIFYIYDDELKKFSFNMLKKEFSIEYDSKEYFIIYFKDIPASYILYKNKPDCRIDITDYLLSFANRG